MSIPFLRIGHIRKNYRVKYYFLRLGLGLGLGLGDIDVMTSAFYVRM